MNDELAREDYLRYSRNLMLPQVGLIGQRKLKSASVLIVGLGGLGSPVSLYLAAAGVGRLGLADYDVVDLSNLQRQIVHSSSTIGQSKAVSAAKRLSDLNPGIQLDVIGSAITSENALEKIAPYQVIVDATDNFASRYLLNDACHLTDKPLVYGSVYRFEGQASIFHGMQNACYRCIFPLPPPPELAPSCAEGGVLGVLPGIIGMIQSTETIKLILGIESTLKGSLLIYDALRLSFQLIQTRKDPNCALCGNKPTVTRLQDYNSFCGSSLQSGLEGQEGQEFRITSRDLYQDIQSGIPITLIDVREPHELEISCLPGAVNIPFWSLAANLDKLTESDDIVIICRTDTRSRHAMHILRGKGFTRVRYLAGGMNAWAELIDPGMNPY